MATSAGMACALASGAFFMLAATWAAMPVSTTHAIVGEHSFLKMEQIWRLCLLCRLTAPDTSMLQLAGGEQ